MMLGSIGLATGLSSSLMGVAKIGGLVSKLPVGQRLFNTAKAVSQLGEDGTVDLSRGKIKGDEYMNYPEANVYNEKNGAQKFTEPDIGGEPCGKCDACFLRLKGFDQAGAIDPLNYPIN